MRGVRLLAASKAYKQSCMAMLCALPCSHLGEGTLHVIACRHSTTLPTISTLAVSSLMSRGGWWKGGGEGGALWRVLWRKVLPVLGVASGSVARGGPSTG